MTQIISKIKAIRWQTVMIIILAAMVAVGTESCNKQTGKLSKKEKKAQIEMYKKQLTEIKDGTSKLSLQDQEKLVNEAINKHFNDPELNQLIIEAGQKIKAAYADNQKQHEKLVAESRTKLYDLLANKDNLSADELAAQLASIKALNLGDDEINELIARVDKKIADMRAGSSPGSLQAQLESAFQSIVTAAKGNNLTQANSVIQSTISKYFESESTPVLIIISKEGSTIDYDKPTTIKNYLNFCKDQKDSRNAIDSYQLNDSGKIKELDLIKLK